MGATYIHAIGLKVFNNKKPSIQKYMYMVTYWTV